MAAIQVDWQHVQVENSSNLVIVVFHFKSLSSLVGPWYSFLVSTYVVCESLSVMHKHIPVHIPQTVNFCPNFPESTPPPISENFRFEMTKVYSKIPSPHFGKLQI